PRVARPPSTPRSDPSGRVRDPPGGCQSTHPPVAGRRRSLVYTAARLEEPALPRLRPILLRALFAAACATTPRAPEPEAPPPLLPTPPPAAQAEEARPEVLAVARLAAVGDILMHGALKEAAAAAAE